MTYILFFKQTTTQDIPPLFSFGSILLQFFFFFFTVWFCFTFHVKRELQKRYYKIFDESLKETYLENYFLATSTESWTIILMKNEGPHPGVQLGRLQRSSIYSIISHVEFSLFQYYVYTQNNSILLKPSMYSKCKSYTIFFEKIGHRYDNNSLL